MESDAPTTIDDSAVPEADCTAVNVHVDAPAQYLSDLVSFGWLSIAKWSILAAGVYPLLLFLILLVVFGPRSFVPSVHPSRLTDFDQLVNACVIILIFSVGSMIWVGAMAALTLPFLHMVARSLELRVTFTRLGAFTGGLLVFVATLPNSLDWPRMQRIFGWWEIARMMLIVPGIATIAGQIGGAYGGLRASRRAANWAQARQDLVERGWRQPSQPASDDEDGLTDTLASVPRIRFRIAHLLWVAVWVSVLLALIRLVGIPFQTVLPVVFGWLLFQSLTLWLGGVLVRRLGPLWTRRRQGRST